MPVVHRGGNPPHDDCANRVPQNSFPGWDVLVNGKQFDALALATRKLWDVKTDNYDFVVGVKSAAHKAALERIDDTLTIVVMDWC